MRYLKFLLVLPILYSCNIEEPYNELCTGGCIADIVVNLPQDGNGFYHVTGDRFDVEVFANATTETYRYNNNSVIEAQFYGEVVQSTTLYLSRINEAGTKYKTKRIVGPIFQEMVGDTLDIYGDVYWDGGTEYELQKFSFKIIIE